MNRSERYRQRGDGRVQYRQNRPEVSGKKELNRVLDILINISSVFHGFYNGREIIIGQNHGRRVFGNLASRNSHGYADVCLF